MVYAEPCQWDTTILSSLGSNSQVTKSSTKLSYQALAVTAKASLSHSALAVTVTPWDTTILSSLGSYGQALENNIFDLQWQY